MCQVFLSSCVVHVKPCCVAVVSLTSKANQSSQSCMCKCFLRPRIAVTLMKYQLLASLALLLRPFTVCLFLSPFFPSFPALIISLFRSHFLCLFVFFPTRLFILTFPFTFSLDFLAYFTFFAPLPVFLSCNAKVFHRAFYTSGCFVVVIVCLCSEHHFRFIFIFLLFAH